MKELPDTKSTLKDVYALLGASTLTELSDRYTEEDQKIMQAQLWDYQNPDLVTNKVREILETIDLGDLSFEESLLRSNILWLWYHHAISSAIWKYSNKEKAKEFSKKALGFQPEGHPNKITRLFYLLLHNDLVGAEKWKDTITHEPEKSSAEWLMAELKKFGFLE